MDPTPSYSRKEILESGQPLLIAGSWGSQLAPSILGDSNVSLDPERAPPRRPAGGGAARVGLVQATVGTFFRTALETILGDLGVSTLVPTGCNFSNCPRTTLYEASERDFRLIAVEDAISGIYERGVAELRGIGGRVMSAEHVLRWAQLSSYPAAAESG